jgi:hypothetical protein
MALDRLQLGSAQGRTDLRHRDCTPWRRRINCGHKRRVCWGIVYDAGFVVVGRTYVEVLTDSSWSGWRDCHGRDKAKVQRGLDRPESARSFGREWAQNSTVSPRDSWLAPVADFLRKQARDSLLELLCPIELVFKSTRPEAGIWEFMLRRLQVEGGTSGRAIGRAIPERSQDPPANPGRQARVAPGLQFGLVQPKRDFGKSRFELRRQAEKLALGVHQDGTRTHP